MRATFGIFISIVLLGLMLNTAFAAGPGQGWDNDKAIRDQNRDGSCLDLASLDSSTPLYMARNSQGKGQGQGDQLRKRDGSCLDDTFMARNGQGKGQGQGNGQQRRLRDGSGQGQGNGQGQGSQLRKRDGSCQPTG